MKYSKQIALFLDYTFILKSGIVANCCSNTFQKQWTCIHAFSLVRQWLNPQCQSVIMLIPVQTRHLIITQWTFMQPVTLIAQWLNPQCLSVFATIVEQLQSFYLTQWSLIHWLCNLKTKQNLTQWSSMY